LSDNHDLTWYEESIENIRSLSQDGINVFDEAIRMKKELVLLYNFEVKLNNLEDFIDSNIRPGGTVKLSKLASAIQVDDNELNYLLTELENRDRLQGNVYIIEEEFVRYDTDKLESQRLRVIEQLYKVGKIPVDVIRSLLHFADHSDFEQWFRKVSSTYPLSIIDNYVVYRR